MFSPFELFHYKLQASIILLKYPIIIQIIKMSSLNCYMQQVKRVMRKRKYQELWAKCKSSYEGDGPNKFTEILLGPEFSALNDSDFVLNLMWSHYYLPNRFLTEAQIQEFRHAFDRSTEFDQRNVGFLIGMVALSLVGFVGFGFAVFGALGGAVLGALLGRYAGKRITRKLQRKPSLLEMDVYELKMNSLVSWAQQKTQKYQYNLNMARFITEKLIFEAKTSLHYRQLQNSLRAQLRGVLLKVSRLLQQQSYRNAMILSLSLAKQQLRILKLIQSEQQVHETQLEAQEYHHFLPHRSEIEVSFIRYIDNVLKPCFSILSEKPSKNAEIRELRSDIQKFLMLPEILQIQRDYPDPQMNIYYIKMVAGKLAQVVITEDLLAYIKQQNFRSIEDLGKQLQQFRSVSPIKESVQSPPFLKADVEAAQATIPIYQEEQNESSILAIQPPTRIKLQIRAHPNKVYMSKIDPKSQLQETPEISAQEIYQILEIQPQNKEMDYPSHYSVITIKKFQLFEKLNDEPLEDWELAVKTKDAEVYKSAKSGSDSVFIRGYGIIKSVSLEQVVAATYEPEKRRKWDKLLSGFQILKEEWSDTHVITYHVVPPVRFVSIREWVQRRIIRYDYPAKGQVCLLFYSVEGDEYPHKPNMIRAYTEISTMVFEQVQSGVKISILSNNDIKGYIPKMIVNRESAKGPVGWFQNLENACKGLY